MMRAAPTIGWASQPARGGTSTRRVWATMVLLSLAASLAIGLAPVQSVLLLAFLSLVIAVVLSPGFAVGSILVSSLCINGLSSAIGLPSQALLLTRVLIGVFGLSVLLQLRRGRRVHAHLLIVTEWVAVLAISALFGMSERILSFQGLWAYACGPVAFLAILYSDLSIRSLRRVSLVVAFIIMAELPIVVLQSLFFATNVDQIGGTFGTVGGTSIIAVVMAFAWTVAVAALVGRGRVWLIPIGLGIATVLLVCEAKAGFLFCAIGTLGAGLTKGVVARRLATALLQYTAIAVAAVAAMFGGYLYAGKMLTGGERAAAIQLRDISDPGAMRSYLFSYGPQGQAGRLEGVRLALTQDRPAIADVLLGRGPGLLSSSALTDNPSGFLRATGTTFNWATSLTRSILETGILGTLLYVGVVGSAVATVGRSWQPRISELGTSVVAASVGVATVYVFSGIYAMTWHRDAVAVLFWCLIGMAAKWGQLRGAPEAKPILSPQSPGAAEIG